jgi:hypothetical protein
VPGARRWLALEGLLQNVAVGRVDDQRAAAHLRLGAVRAEAEDAGAVATEATDARLPQVFHVVVIRTAALRSRFARAGSRPRRPARRLAYEAAIGTHSDDRPIRTTDVVCPVNQSVASRSHERSSSSPVGGALLTSVVAVTARPR